MRPKTDHGFNGEAHSRFGRSDHLALGIMGNIWCSVEQFVDTVATIRFDHTAVPALSVLLDYVSRLTEEHPGFDVCDRLIKAFACCLDNADRIGIR